MKSNGLMEDHPFVCMIRHAEKEQMKADPFGNSVGLTNKGRKGAFRFGLDFKSKRGEIDRIVTSPLRRCIETAEEISRAFESEIIIDRSELLGDPGAYIEDPELAGRYFLEFSSEVVVKNLIDGVYMKGFRNIGEGTDLMTAKIVNDLQKTCFPIIYITHDVILFPFFYSLSGNNTANKFDYLESINIQIDKGFLKCSRN